MSLLGLSACTSTGGDAAATLAMTSTADPALPDTVAVLPTSSTADPQALASAGAAEASVQAVAASAGTSEAPTLASAGAARAEAQPIAGTQAKPAALTVARAAPIRGAAATAPAATEVAFTPNAYAKADRPQSDLDALIAKYAAVYEVPVELVRRVVKRESNFNPAARSRSYWGLMQISHATARGMGYKGPAKGLLDAETNLKYAVKYLRGAWLVAGGNHDQAVRLYARGYYYDAKRRGLLDETGLGSDRRKRMASSL